MTKDLKTRIEPCEAHDLITCDRAHSTMVTSYKYKAEFVDKLVAEYDQQQDIIRSLEAKVAQLERKNKKHVKFIRQILDETAGLQYSGRTMTIRAMIKEYFGEKD